MNLESAGPIPDVFTTARALPTVVIEPVCRTWETYLGSMRADYRRRVKRILAGSERLAIGTAHCNTFSTRHHELYGQVWAGSDAKLEKLTRDFFRMLPGEFHMITAHLEERLVGWAIVLETAEGMDYFLGGIDYEHNQDYL